MSYSNIKRFLSAALLLAFTTPSTFAISSGYDYAPGRSALTFNSEVSLTEKNDVITLSLRDSDVKQVLRMFADKAGMNIIFHNSVSGQVTLDMVDMPINEAFNLVLQVSGLNYYKQGSTMIVMSKAAPDNAAYSKQEMMIFPVNYVDAGAIAEFLNKNVFGMKKAGMSSVDAATVNSATNELIVFGMPSDAAIVEKVIEQFDREPFSKTFAVNHTTPAEMADMICNVLLPSRGISASKSRGSGNRETFAPSPGTSTGGAAGIMTGAASSTSDMKLGEGIVACSATSAAASSVVAPFNMQNLSIAYFPQRGTITLMGGSEAQAAMIENFIKANDIKQPQALLEVSIVELTEQGSKEFQNNWNLSSNGWGFGFDANGFTANRMAGSGNRWIPAVNYVFNNGVADSAGNMISDSKLPYLKGDEWVVPQQQVQNYMVKMPMQTRVSWSMKYLIENSKARVLANPKILITNGQESIIDLTQDYVEKVTAEYLTSSTNGDGATGTAQKNYTIAEDLGIKVTLTPFISPEGYVTLNIKPEYSTIAEQIYGQGEVFGVLDLAATLLSRRNLDLKNVRIKDGETLVLGGMIQETEQKTVTKIPVLGDLPLVGPLFRSSSTAKAKSELVIMITPKIMNDGEGNFSDLL